MADLRTSVPPQLAQATSTTSIMLDVIVALIPALGMSVYLFGPRVLALTLISVGACVLSEYLYRRLTHQSNTLRDCSACVTGLLLAMCLPAASPYWVPLLGGVFAIVVVLRRAGQKLHEPGSGWADAAVHLPLLDDHLGGRAGLSPRLG